MLLGYCSFQDQFRQEAIDRQYALQRRGYQYEGSAGEAIRGWPGYRYGPGDGDGGAAAGKA